MSRSTCARGHAQTERNVYLRGDGARVCRACSRETARRRRSERAGPPALSGSVDYALARLRAERTLVAAHRVEADALRAELGHIRGTIKLVAAHRTEYTTIYREAVRSLGGTITGAAAHRPELPFMLERRATA